jgi:HK97 family phage major capsid protein
MEMTTMAKSPDDLRRERAAAAAAMQMAANALNDLQAGADATAAEKAFADASAAFDAADAAVKRAEAVESAMAAAAVPAAHTTTPGASVPAQAANPDHKGIEVGLIVGALAAGKGDVDKAKAYLEKEGHSGVGASLTTGTDAAGGFTLPRPTATGLIELLRSRVVVRRAGAMVFPMPAGKMRMAKQGSAATATYGAELAPIAPSTPGFAAIDESFKKLTSLVPVSNDLLRMSSLAMAQVVTRDLLDVMARREDVAFLRGDGLSNTPKGIRNWALMPNWQAAVANTVAAVEAAINRMVNLVEDSDVPMTMPGFVMRASTKNFLAALRNATTGYKVFPSIEETGTLKGWPIYTTSQIPNNLGAGTNEAEIYFVDFAQMMIGDALNVTVSVSTEATYVDGGTTHSAFQKDQTLMRAIAEHDFAPAYDQAIAGCNGVNWDI